ncbi:MAG: hypothetical protein Q4P07_04150 [Ornithinimicrobium sp.]|uniref:hypothetical protein n=1 Tax=Ornithinimicrobium sp. TaxID=1977084 RepID=UPI0026DF251B|nr:hypothetical protein [Ornithinimicrobium sp.]MDO5739322.1 hypothetical protein [Ornithinimicrobium sp.]
MSTGESLRGVGVLDISPEELRQAARQLRGVGAQVEALSDSLVLVAVRGPDGWAGLAALEQTARTQATARLVGLAVGPGSEAATVLERVAASADECATAVLSWTRHLEEALIELHRLRTLGVPPDIVDQEVWRRRVAELEETVARCHGLVDRAELEFEEVQRASARTITQAWARVEHSLATATVLAQTGLKAKSAHARLVTIGIAAPGLWALAAARRSGDAAARAQAVLIARARLKLIRASGVVAAVTSAGKKLPPWLRPPGVVSGPILATGQWWGAWSDLQDGGGYTGWRGETTKFFAGLAVVGIPASFVVLAPPVALTGITMTASYSVWMSGNWIYDNRGRIADARDQIREADEALATWTEVQLHKGYQSASVLSGLAMQRLQVRAEDLVTLGGRSDELTRGLRERLRQLGKPLRLSDVRVPRLPLDLGSPWWSSGGPGPSSSRQWGSGRGPIDIGISGVPGLGAHA